VKEGDLLKKPFLFLLLPFIVLFLPVSTIWIGFSGDGCYYSLKPNSTLEVHYVHSVSLTKVVDIYRISGDGIYFTKEMWQDSLAGQPLDFQYKQGSFYVKESNEFLGKSWGYWFIPLNNATISVEGKIVFVQPKIEGTLEIRVERVPLILLLTRRC
jgi:hypothetical protein